jgi:hypothetical protein
LIVGTADNTVSRLAAASTNGYVLTVNSATGTGLEWQEAPAGYLAPTIGTTVITSGTTVSTITGLTLSNPTLSGTVTAASSTGTNGQYLKSTGTGVEWSSVDSLPSQTGNSGKFLSTNGTTASWETTITPSAFTAEGAILVGVGAGDYVSKAVGTNGTVLMADSGETGGVKWATVTTDATPTVFLLMGA